MIEIIPAIMPTSTGDLESKLVQVAGLVPVVQIDIMDGKFVHDVSWPYTEDDEYFQEILTEDAGLPYWDQFDFEVDLMVVRPEEVINDWIAAGVRRIVVHEESTDNLDKIITDFRTRFPKSEQPDVFDSEIGVAQNNNTPIETIFPFLDRLDFVQLMGIVEIGKQGQPFDERVLQKIRTLRAHSPNIAISIDGAVGFDTAQALVEAGANRLVIGSAIFKSEDVAVAIKEFKNFGK